MGKVLILILSALCFVFALVPQKPNNKGKKPRASPTATPTPVPDQHVVRVVYFYPSDYSPDPRYLERIDPFMRDVQRWFAQQLGGRTFKALPVQIIKGTQPTTYYTQSDMPTWVKVYAELGVDCGGDVIPFIWLARTLPHANGRSCGPWYAGTFYNGDATISEANLDPEIVATETGFCPNGFPLGDWRCSPQASRGGTAHELGHVFTLPHPAGCPDNEPYCSETIMWGWWLWPNTSFIETAFAPEKSTLLGSSWFWNKE